MTQLPTPPKPADRTVAEVSEPPHESRTVWTAAAGVLAAVAGGVTALAGLFDADPVWKPRLLLIGGGLMIVSQVLGNIGSIFARTGGIQAAARVLEKMRGRGT